MTISPTPWRVEDRFWDGECCVVDAAGACVAGPVSVRQYDSCTIVDGIAEGDAALIAAAPDLLAACEALLKAVATDENWREAAVEEAARFAIAKARGTP